MGDKKVLKKIVRDGKGFDRPNEGSEAKGDFLIISFLKSFQWIFKYVVMLMKPIMISAFEVIYIGKLKDGTIIERNGSDEEPFEYTCFEGTY